MMGRLTVVVLAALALTAAPAAAHKTTWAIAGGTNFMPNEGTLSDQEAVNAAAVAVAKAHPLEQTQPSFMWVTRRINSTAACVAHRRSAAYQSHRVLVDIDRVAAGYYVYYLELFWWDERHTC